jgi:hypothetical protein
MKFDKYTLIARILPAIISIIPIVVFNSFYLNSQLSVFLHSLLAIVLINGISMPLIFIFLYAQASRYISKTLFEKHYFKDELRMPSTDYLMPSSKYSTQELRGKIYKKILKDFKISISIKKGNAEDQDLRRAISEAVALIRKKVGHGKLLHQHNTEYGFARNLIGGSLISFLLSLFNIYFFAYYYPNSFALKLSFVTAILYLIPLVFSKKIMTDHGQWYAKVLIQEYLGS